MFEFEKLDVYTKAKIFNAGVRDIQGEELSKILFVMVRNLD